MKVTSVFTLITLYACLLSCRKEKTRICELYDSPVGFSIGTIQSLSSSPFKTTYKYAYTVNGADYTSTEKVYGVGQKDESLIGKQFIVVYAQEDHSKSDLNTDFLIESQQDFNDFQLKYEAGPPSPDFPNTCK